MYKEEINLIDFGRVSIESPLVEIEKTSDGSFIAGAEGVKNILRTPDTDIMICETNYWMNLHPRYTEEQKEALRNKESRYNGQAEWVPEFIDMLVNINNPHLKAVIFYELMDEPVKERNGNYCGEAHFGFIECDENGANRKIKPAFYSLQQKIKEINSSNQF